ncbi:lysophospholipid acyltransferase family protein [Thiococcus pfennigii]|uniref:lysophospholipid acyltransferase family protein n=1 Tax=Thiococcus pfennigii TaxID=1057 RepID=UPI001908B743|nr:lysophospholipid acyltransferase family protein [Thiococcus pfennigii]MBK1732927.1 lipid A biosynthesis acyltransferase [Thiococcus pfennigii]
MSLPSSADRSPATAANSPAPGRPARAGAGERAIRWLVGLVARLPLPVIHGLGDWLGRLMTWIPNRQRRNALINIASCLPSLSPTEQIALRDANLREFGKTYLEIGYLWLRPTEQVLGLVREVRGAELLRRREGKGLIVLSPHIGAWELAGLYLSLQGPTAIFYKPQKHLDDLILAARRRGGARLAPITAKGIRVLVQALERGEYVGILPDQEPRLDKGAVFAPFFGVPALTMLLVNRLARRTGTPVIFMFAERLPRAGGFRIHCLPAPEGIDGDDDQTAATALNRGIEQCVRLRPAQFLWPYKRFRRRPEALPKLYRGPLGDARTLARLASHDEEKASGLRGHGARDRA